MNEFPTPTLMVIGTDCTGSCKSNGHDHDTLIKGLEVVFNYEKNV